MARGKHEKRRPGHVAEEGDGFHAPPGLQTIGAFAMLAALVGVAAVSYGPLKRQVADLRAASATALFHWPGETETWLPQEERRRLEEIVAGIVSADPFDVQSLEVAEEVLAESGWFESIDSVRRLPGGQIEVDGEWRYPAAVVRSGGREMLVSRRGSLLPMEYPLGGGWPMRFVRGAWAGPPRLNEGSYAFGEAWTGGDVQAAIDLLAYLRRSDVWEYVAGVDCSGFMDHGRLTVVTVQGGEVVWGAPPGSGAPGEEDDGMKRSRFERLMTDPGWISAGRPRIEIYPSIVLIDETTEGE
jgi:hypothetical protein